jgi:hypothetical protein
VQRYVTRPFRVAPERVYKPHFTLLCDVTLQIKYANGDVYAGDVDGDGRRRGGGELTQKADGRVVKCGAFQVRSANVTM